MESHEDARRQDDPITATEIVAMAGAVALIVTLLLFIVAAL